MNSQKPWGTTVSDAGRYHICFWYELQLYIIYIYIYVYVYYEIVHEVSLHKSYKTINVSKI